MTRGTLNELALFAGAGGGILGSRLLGWRTVCAVEIEPYCREVLLRRQEEKILEPFPIWDDIRTFDGKHWCGKVDIITAGFPCQPFSSAAHGRNIKNSLWEEAVRVIEESKVQFVLLENVLGAKKILPKCKVDLEGMGFNVVPPLEVEASYVGAPHKRRRFWILAHANNSGKSVGTEYDETRGMSTPCRNETTWWDYPRVAGIYDGDAHRMDRIKATGNAQVPAVVSAAWDLLTND